MSVTKYFIFAFLLILPTGLYAEVITKEELLETGLPLLVIETINCEEPTCDYVTHPEGAMGEGITNRTKVGGAIILLQGENVLYDSGPFEKGTSGIELRLRGNSSAYTEKKPYKIKLQKKADLLCRDDKYADKDWLLIKDEKPFTSENDMNLKPVIGFLINQLLGLQWTPAGKYVNVIMNEEYKGIYYLVESVKRNNNCRIDIDKETGYLIEYDPYWWNESIYFDTNKTMTSMSFKYTFKEPDDDDLTEEKIGYIQSYMNDVELSISDGSYENYIDVESFMNWILAADLLGTNDGGGSNVFLTKYDNTTSSKIRMGNLWDFDGIMNRENQWPGNHNILYFRQLREHESFNDAYISKWNQIYPTLMEKLNDYFHVYLESAEGVALDKARFYEHQKWSSDYQTTNENINAAKTWFSGRIQWMNKQLGISTEIKRLKKEKSEELLFDLKGYRAIHTQSPIYIKDGKKYMHPRQ